MIESISCVIPEITVHNNRPVTTSVAVANFFGKQHRDVTKKIRSLECSPSFTSANFCAVVLTAQAGFDEREIEAYEMTKNGFIFLVMGFTGKKAAAFKEAYIAEFDRMEAELQHRPPAPLMPTFPTGKEFRFVTDVDATGRPISMTVLRPDEFIASSAMHTDMLRHMGMIVIEPEDLGNMTTKKVAMLIDTALRAKTQWIKSVEF